MKIYYIAVLSWDTYHAYTLDYIRPFLSKQKRDEAYEKMKLSPAYKKGDIWLEIDEDEVEDAPEDAVEGQVCATTSARWIEAEVSREDGFICGQKVRIVVLKEEE